MKKLIKFTVCFLLIISAVMVLDLWQDKKTLQENLIRLHVVANSDSRADQEVKLQVKDAIVNHLQPIVEKFSSKEQAMDYIRENLSELQDVANNALNSLGEKVRAVVTLGEEAFDKRVYDTFSLPAGIYDSLRVEIGGALGKNWWCVVFPSLCLPATSTEFEETAVSSGFSQNLSNTLSSDCNLRFFLLDCIGRLEKLFY